jgi:hypothetical protein
MTTDANQFSIEENDVSTFMQTLGQWAGSLPPKEQALFHLMLATAAAAEGPDVSQYLSGFPIANPADVVIAATSTATGSDSGSVVGPSREAIAGDLSGPEAQAAAGSTLARALLNNWAQRASQ